MPHSTYRPGRPSRLYRCGGAEGGLRSACCGFTIVEIIIVVVIIAIAALAAVPMMSSAGSVQIRSAANMIMADLEYAKSMAISRGQNFSVVFDKNTESYRIEDQGGSVIPHPVKKGFDYAV
ncbi:MAG: GspH/FimT family protein, partial [Planctomycetota bacterium]